MPYLVTVNSIFWLTIQIVSTCLDFNEHQDAVLDRDYVQLISLAAPIPVTDAITLCLKILDSLFLTDLSQLVVSTHRLYNIWLLVNFFTACSSDSSGAMMLYAPQKSSS